MLVFTDDPPGADPLVAVHLEASRVPVLKVSLNEAEQVVLSREMLLMFSGAAPPLVRTMLCGVLVVWIVWLPKAREVGVKVTPDWVPVPVRGKLALTVPTILIVAVRNPDVVGAKRTVIVQKADGPSVPGQSFEVE